MEQWRENDSAPVMLRKILTNILELSVASNGLGEVNANLQGILHNTQNINVSADKIVIDTDLIQLNTDQLETILAALSAKIPSDPAREGGNLATLAGKDFATQATLVLLNAKLSSLGQKTSANSVPVVIASDQSVVPFSVLSQTFVATGNGTTQDISTRPVGRFALQVKGTGASASTWTVVLEGSLNGVNFSTILTHDTAIGDGNVVYTGAVGSPCLYFRARVSALTLGPATNIAVTILGVL